MTDRVLRFTVFALAVLLVGCADSHEVNAAFSRTRVSWAVFDVALPDGLRSFAGFEQPLKTVWVPRNRGVVATDLVSRVGGGAVAVSHLGLLTLDDSGGSLVPSRLGAQWPLEAYNTDKLFVWKDKLFVTLSQDAVTSPPASLAWWTTGQTRLAFYPIPSQIREPSRQLAGVTPPAGSSADLRLVWKVKGESGWNYEGSSFALDSGTETAGSVEAVTPRDPSTEPRFAAVRERLAERLGKDVPFSPVEGNGTVLGFTEAGWVAVAKVGEGQARLYHLPELGLAGKYTLGASLTRGFVFTWETSYRGFVGAAGLVHVPFAVLAP